MKLLTTKQHKLDRNRSSGFYTVSLNLEPHHKIHVVYDDGWSILTNTCPIQAKFCLKCAKVGCLKNRGHNHMPKAREARINRTELLERGQNLFFSLLYSELYQAIYEAGVLNMKPVCRLNCLSDIPWELINPDLFEKFSGIQFYDYTSDIDRVLSRKRPENYWLTYSIKENSTEYEIKQVMRAKGNCAAIFLEPEKYYELYGYELVDGELDDIRWDRPGVIFKLKYKKPYGLKMPTRAQLKGFVIDA